MKEKQSLLLALAFVSAALLAAPLRGNAATVYRWIGGASGSWQDAANWSDAAGRPVAAAPSGDDAEAWIDAPSARTIAVNGETTVGRVRFLGTGPLTLDGSRLSVTGVGATQTAWSNECPVVCNVPLTFSGSTSVSISNSTVLARAPVVFNGAIDATGTHDLIFYSKNAANDARITFNAAVTAPNATVYFEATGSGMTVNAPVSAKNYSCSTTGQNTGTVQLYAPVSLSGGALKLNYRTLACMWENIFGETVHVNWSGWYEVGCLQMNGFDQTLDYLTGTYLANNTYAPREGESNDRAIVSTVPATLTLRATQSASAPVRVRGQVSIVYDPLDGAFVQTFTKRPSDTLGTIEVRRGTVRLDDGATFARLSALTLGEGAAFELRTQEIGALLRLSRLDLAKNARLVLADGVRQVFYDGRVVCTLAEGARLELPAGYTFRPQSLARAGQPLAARAYTGRDNPTPGDAEPVDWIVGAGRVELTDGPYEPEPEVIDVAPGAGALDAALAQVVAFRQTDVVRPVELRLRPGRYPLAATLKIDTRFARGEWAPLVIGAADPANKPHLEAGAVVTGWTKGGFAGRDDVWTADVAGLPLLDPCRSLLFNSRWMTPARWPNRDPARPFTVGYARARMPEGLPRGLGGASVAGCGIWQDELAVLRHDWKAGGRWANPTEGWVRVAYRHNWSDATYRITGVTADGVIKLNAAHTEPESLYYVWDHYCVFNLREELDAPGEWYWDRAAGKIHFIPPNGEDPNDGLTVADTVDKAIEVSGAGSLRLENLEISGGRTAVSITADDVMVRGCAIHDCGQRASAISVKGHRVTVSDNDLWNVGGNGISVNEVSGETLVTDRMEVKVDNNYIHHCGLSNVGGTGISFRGQGVSVTHNLIHDCSRHGMNWNGRFNEVGWNRIRHVSYGSDDTAAIYGGGWCQGVGVRIHHNHFSDAYGYHCGNDGQYVFNALCSGIYPDEGSAGLTVDHNFVHGCHQGAMHLHNGRWITISNNVFVSNSELPMTASTYQLSLASWDNSPNGTFANRRPTVVPAWQKLVASDPRWLDFPAFAQDPSDDSKVFSADGRTMMGLQIVQNVFCYPDQGGTRLYNGHSFSILTNRLDRNLVWPGAGVQPKVGLSGKDTCWADWQALGEDVHSVVGDPQFVDLANGDVRFAANSPARSLGIEELDPTACGLVTNAFRPALSVEAEGVREHPEWLVPVVDVLDDAFVRWTGGGGDGKWSNAANWDFAPQDGAGDILVFDTSAGPLVVENDLPDLSVGSIRFQGSSANAVTINGQELVLTAEAAWSNEVPVTVNAPIRHMNTVRRKATFSVYDNLTLNGSLGFQSTTNAVVAGYRRAGGRESCAFNGDITGAETTLELRGANAKQIVYDFRGKLTLAGFRNGCNYGGMTTTLYNPSNEIAVATGAYQPLALADDALHGSVFLFDGYYREMSTKPLQLTSGKTYVLDRIGETGTTWEKSGKPYADALSGTSTTQPITLVLRGTGDATSACSLGSAWNAHWQTGEVSSQTAYPLSLTWDPVGDFTQEFRNRTHLMRGDITVKGGTLRSAGTNVFQNVTTVTVCSGATLDVASIHATCAAFPSLAILVVEDGGTLRAGPGTNPFAVDSVAATLSGTAKISVDPSATLNIGRLTVGGAEIKSGSYTGMPWMTGGGTVKVSGCAAHVWGQPASGEWSDASKWIGGVPTADSVVKLSNGGSYAVTLAASDVVPKSIEGLGDGTALATVVPSGTVTWRDATFEIKSGARLDVPTGASLVLDVTKRFKVGAGGELRVSGGVLSVTNNVQSISVVGTETQTARVSVVSGTLRQSSAAYNGFFNFGEYGVLEQSGGRFEAFPGDTGWRPVSLSGGAWRMSGNAVFEASSSNDVQEIFGTGSTVFSGNGTYNVRKGSSYFKVTPGKAGETAQLTIRDHAGFKTGSFDGFQVGATAGGRAIFEVDTDAAQCRYGIRPFVGVDNGDGELILRRGYVATGYRGLAVGAASGNKWGKGVTGVGGHGIVRVTGGSLYIPANNPASDENIFNGLLVGEASMTFATSPTGDGVQRGEFHLVSGTVTNRQGMVIVGGARSIGTFEQTGGVFLHNTAKSSASLMTIGLSGGRGSYLMGGGVADIRSDVYVGGCLTNAILGACYLSDIYPYPTDCHDAAGTLTVTGGVMTCTKNVYVGADGTGTVAVVGREGELTITKDLVLSNTTATATAAVLSFAFGADGVAPIMVGGKVVNTSGTKLVVDVGAVLTKAKNHRLVRCAGWEGPEITDVTFTGACAEKVRLVRDAQGLLLTIPPPLLVIIR